jgi:hypothetical protein
LVLIGVDMDEAALRREFERCLLTDAELALGDTAHLSDPFEPWETPPGSRLDDPSSAATASQSLPP